jgi:hypothetical protein
MASRLGSFERSAVFFGSVLFTAALVVFSSPTVLLA